MKLGKCVILWSMLLTGYDKGQLRFIIESLEMATKMGKIIQTQFQLASGVTNWKALEAHANDKSNGLGDIDSGVGERCWQDGNGINDGNHVTLVAWLFVGLRRCDFNYCPINFLRSWRLCYFNPIKKNVRNNQFYCDFINWFVNNCLTFQLSMVGCRVLMLFPGRRGLQRSVGVGRKPSTSFRRTGRWRYTTLPPRWLRSKWWHL